ncbi:hypothetical protein J3F84DRAFT_390484 [Trichoderma pleuroticola]
MLGRQGHGQGDSRVVFLRAGIYRSGGQDNDSCPRHDACRWLRARGNWHLALLAANRALRFPMSKVGSVSPAATALHRTASRITALRNSRSRSVDTQMCVSPLQRPIPSARNHCYADTTLVRHITPSLQV